MKRVVSGYLPRRQSLVNFDNYIQDIAAIKSQLETERRLVGNEYIQAWLIEVIEALDTATWKLRECNSIDEE